MSILGVGYVYSGIDQCHNFSLFLLSDQQGGYDPLVPLPLATPVAAPSRKAVP